MEGWIKFTVGFSLSWLAVSSFLLGAWVLGILLLVLLGVVLFLDYIGFPP